MTATHITSPHQHRLHDPAGADTATCSGCGALYRHPDLGHTCPLCGVASGLGDPDLDREARLVVWLVASSIANLVLLGLVALAIL